MTKMQKWDKEADERLLAACRMYGFLKDWKAISDSLKRSIEACRTRYYHLQKQIYPASNKQVFDLHKEKLMNFDLGDYD